MQRATLNIYMEQLQLKGQKLTQLDLEIAALIEKPKDLEKETFDSEEIQSLNMEKIYQTKAFLEIVQQSTQESTPGPTEQIIQPTNTNVSTGTKGTTQPAASADSANVANLPSTSQTEQTELWQVQLQIHRSPELR